MVSFPWPRPSPKINLPGVWSGNNTRHSCSTRAHESNFASSFRTANRAVRLRIEPANRTSNQASGLRIELQDCIAAANRAARLRIELQDNQSSCKMTNLAARQRIELQDCKSSSRIELANQAMNPTYCTFGPPYNTCTQLYIIYNYSDG